MPDEERLFRKEKRIGKSLNNIIVLSNQCNSIMHITHAARNRTTLPLKAKRSGKKKSNKMAMIVQW